MTTTITILLAWLVKHLFMDTDRFIEVMGIETEDEEACVGQ